MSLEAHPATAAAQRTIPLPVLNNEKPPAPLFTQDPAARHPSPSKPRGLTDSPSPSVPHPLDTAPAPLPAHLNRAHLLDAYLGDDRSNLALCELFEISIGQLSAYIFSTEAESAIDLSRRLAAHRAAHIAAHARLKTLRTLGDLASAAPHPGTSVEADTRTLSAHTRARDAARKSALALHRIAADCSTGPAPLSPTVPTEAPSPALGGGGGGVGAADGGGSGKPPFHFNH